MLEAQAKQQETVKPNFVVSKKDTPAAVSTGPGFDKVSRMRNALCI
jgi:hypothetical protein